MRTTLFGLSMLIAVASAPALASDAPAHAASLTVPRVATPARDAARQPAPAAVRPDRRVLDPAACASLCRMFEFLGSLERRKPSEPVPTS